jgi:5-methylcytosine-specific restriction endonuclease McrA
MIETTKEVSGDYSELKIFLSMDDLAKLEEVRAFLAHQMKDPASNAELIRKMAEISKNYMTLKKTGNASEAVTIRNVKSKNRTQPLCSVSPTSEVAALMKDQDQVKDQDVREAFEKPVSSKIMTRFIPVQVKRELFKRSQMQCEHVDSISNIRCGGKFKLEIDHRLPFGLGGGNEIANLQILCRAHNVMRTKDL